MRVWAVRSTIAYFEQACNAINSYEQSLKDHMEEYMFGFFKQAKRMAILNRFFRGGGLLTLILSLILGGCRKDSAWAPSNMEVQEQGKSNATTPYSAMENIQRLLDVVIRKDEFRQVVYDMVDSRFDDDTNVLLQDLVEVEYSDSVINSTMVSIASNLEAFKDLDDYHYYPQIFIPFFDHHVQNNGLWNSGLVNVIYLDVAASADTLGPVLQGVLLDGTGLSSIVNGVDSAYAYNNEVWVLSLNERVDSEGNNFDEKSNCSGSGLNIRINRLAAKVHKEPWVSGAFRGSHPSLENLLEWVGSAGGLFCTFGWIGSG